jgi:anti-anti-sigma regulatory factor
MQIGTFLTQGRVPVAVLQPHGDLDAYTYQELIAAAQREWKGGARNMVLDLGDVPYLSSSGLVAIHTIARMLKGQELPDLKAGWSTIHAMEHEPREVHPYLKLLKPQPPVEKVLALTGFRQMFDIHADLETAVAAF